MDACFSGFAIARDATPKEISEDYLTLNQENQAQKKEIQELKTSLALAEQLANLKIQEEQTEAQIQVPPK